MNILICSFGWAIQENSPVLPSPLCNFTSPSVLKVESDSKSKHCKKTATVRPASHECVMQMSRIEGGGCGNLVGVAGWWVWQPGGCGNQPGHKFSIGMAAQ